MKKTARNGLVIAGAIICFCGTASAKDPDVGQVEYRSSCAPCHGIDGKGDGPVSKAMKTRPADLTVLAKKNKGVFPVNSVYRTIDGRDPVAGHGSREMPVWGYRFVPLTKLSPKSADDYILDPPGSPEAIVHARILSVIDYLNRIQQK
jgi:hypothetical protein